MADNISDLFLLTQIVAAGSLTKAAVNLDSSPPAVSRRLASLEARLGVRLIERNARRFQLTEAGSVFYERAQHILAEIEAAEAEVVTHTNHLKGRLRIGAMVQLGRQRLAPDIARFSELHPGLDIDFVLSDAPKDLIEDDLDIIFQVDVPPGANFVARKMADSRLTLCASPEYLRRRGRPEKPEDLLRHDCLCLRRGGHVLKRWRFVDSGQPVEVGVNPRLVCNSGELLYNWAVQGYGIAQKFQWDIQKDLDAGILEECLPGYTDAPVTLYAVYAYRRPQPAKIGVFLDYISDLIRIEREKEQAKQREG